MRESVLDFKLTEEIVVLIVTLHIKKIIRCLATSIRKYQTMYVFYFAFKVVRALKYYFNLNTFISLKTI